MKADPHFRIDRIRVAGVGGLIAVGVIVIFGAIELPEVRLFFLVSIPVAVILAVILRLTDRAS